MLNPRFVIASAVFTVVIQLSSHSPAADINWVGYQFGPPQGQGEPPVFLNPFDDASFFDADNWLNYSVPGPSDNAILDTGFDLQNNGMPDTIYFGNYIRPAVALYAPDAKPVPGGDAEVNHLTIRNGSFSFLFTDEGTSTSHGSLTSDREVLIADTTGASASLLLKGGELTSKFVTHIAPGNGSRGSVELNGANAKWSLMGLVNLGWVGDGTVSVVNGAQMTFSDIPASNSFGGTDIYAGIRNQSSGTLNVLSGGHVNAPARISIGDGHEATGFAHGEMTVSGVGSNVTTQSLQVGSLNATGVVVVSQGGSVDPTEFVGVDSNFVGPSSMLVTDAGSLVNCPNLLWVNSNGQNATFTVANRATAQFHEATINSDASGPIGPATIIAKSDGLLQLQQRLGLFKQYGASTVDVRDQGRIEIGAVATPAGSGEIRVGSGGLIYGNGTLRGHVVVEKGGAISPGFSPGTVDIDGDLTLESGSTLTLEVGGTAPGQYDTIHVSGEFEPEGSLVVRFLNGYQPQADAPPPLITVSELPVTDFASVTFENIDMGAVPPSWQDGSFAFSVVPEPRTTSLLLVAVCCLQRRHRPKLISLCRATPT